MSKDFLRSVSQPMWGFDHTEADYLPAGVSAVSQLPWRISRRSRPRDSAVAHWRLAKLPRCLSSEDLNRLIAACDGSSPGRLRDRAIVLLLVRLGLRAGDVAQLRLQDIDWNRGTLQVIGKGRYQVRLPLPQDVGDAMLRYLERRPTNNADYVFIRSIAPYRSGTLHLRRRRKNSGLTQQNNPGAASIRPSQEDAQPPRWGDSDKQECRAAHSSVD